MRSIFFNAPFLRARRKSVRLLWAIGFIGTVALAVSASPSTVAPLPDDPACTDQDRAFMRRANGVAEATSLQGNGAYGAVLVKNGKILMEFGADSRTSGDVTHHAETGLVSLASRKFGRETVAASVLYTSTEPCIMCCGAIRMAGIKKFVYGVTGIQSQRQRGATIPPQPLQCREVFTRVGATDVVILGPLLEAEGLAVHAAANARAAAR